MRIDGHGQVASGCSPKTAESPRYTRHHQWRDITNASHPLMGAHGTSYFDLKSSGADRPRLICPAIWSSVGEEVCFVLVRPRQACSVADGSLDPDHNPASFLTASIPGAAPEQSRWSLQSCAEARRNDLDTDKRHPTIAARREPRIPDLWRDVPPSEEAACCDHDQNPPNPCRYWISRIRYVGPALC